MSHWSWAHRAVVVELTNIQFPISTWKLYASGFVALAPWEGGSMRLTTKWRLEQRWRKQESILNPNDQNTIKISLASLRENVHLKLVAFLIESSEEGALQKGIYSRNYKVQLLFLLWKHAKKSQSQDCLWVYCWPRKLYPFLPLRVLWLKRAFKNLYLSSVGNNLCVFLLFKLKASEENIC